METARGHSIFRNIFSGGIDFDTDPKMFREGKYRDAYHVTLSGASKFTGLKAMGGTDKVSELIAGPIAIDDINIMRGVRSRYWIVADGVAEDCATIFWSYDNAGTTYFVISVFRPSNASVTDIYNEVVDSSYMSLALDAVVYRDGLVDNIYFTDGYTYPKRLKCILNGSITDRNLDLFRRYPSNGLVVSDVIYTPKEEPIVGTLHKMNLVREPDVVQPYELWQSGYLLFDTTGGSSDISALNSFEMAADLAIYQSIVNGTPGAEFYAEATIKDRTGATLYTISNTLVSSIFSTPPSGFYNASLVNQKMTVNLGENPYNPTPFFCQVRVTKTSSAVGTSRAQFSLRNIYPTGSDIDAYQLGTSLNMTVQIT
jgi:hypothetical protein